MTRLQLSFLLIKQVYFVYKEELDKHDTVHKKIVVYVFNIVVLWMIKIYEIFS